MFEFYQAIVTAEEGGGGGFGGFIVPLVLMFAVFYFLIIRPQSKKAKHHQLFLDSVKKGDQIVTTGGLCGRVTGLDDKTVTVEIAERVRVKVLRSAVAGPQSSVTDSKDKK